MPSWAEVRSPKETLLLEHLDLGEREAIALAAEVRADVVLIDDQAGRQEALRRSLRVAGTLSILDDGDQAGLVDFDEAVAALQKTSFRISPAVLSEIRENRPRR